MHWAEQIRECQNRPEGMDVSTWCEQNNITKANYYYRLKRVRQMCLDQLPEAEKPAFVELGPYDKNTLFLFCGRKNSRIKALLVNGRTYDLFSCIYN